MAFKELKSHIPGNSIPPSLISDDLLFFANQMGRPKEGGRTLADADVIPRMRRRVTTRWRHSPSTPEVLLLNHNHVGIKMSEGVDGFRLSDYRRRNIM